MKKEKVSNKAEKSKVENKVDKKAEAVTLDISKLPVEVVIIATSDKHLIMGNEYVVNREMAKLLVEKGAAKLK